MKIVILMVVLLTGSTATLAQSKSYQALKNKFSDQPDVHSFSLIGWVGRMVLSLTGDYEFKEAIEDVDHIRVITIPKSAFSAQQVSVNGFKKIVKQDSYEELAFIREEGEEVSVYIRQGKHNQNYYFVLVEEKDEVVAIELKGYIDLKSLNPKTTTLASLK